MKNTIAFYIIFSFFIIIFALLYIPSCKELNFSAIDYFSFAIFMVYIAIGLVDKNWFLFIWICAIISLPSAVNNFLPSVWLGDPNELGAAQVPLISFFDFISIVGILKYGLKNKVMRLPKFSLISSLVIVLFIVNNSFNRTTEYFTLSVYGLWQTRFFLYSVLILSAFKAHTVRNLLPIALVVGISALVIEALLFTVVNGTSTMTSGSLGTNSFGNLLGAISLYFIVYSYFKKSGMQSVLFYTFALILLYCSYLTGTRMSIVAFAMSVITLYIVQAKKLSVFTLLFVIPLIYISAPDEYQVLHLLNFDDVVKALKFGFEFDGKSAIITEENSSVLARLNLWRTSGMMIMENPVNGIGAGTWNLLKSEYGFGQSVLIDSHNGYLSFMSEYGLIVGGYFIWFIYGELLNIRLHLRDQEAGIIIIVYYAFSELTNSGVMRPQVFSFLLLVVLYLYKNKIDCNDKI